MNNTEYILNPYIIEKNEQIADNAYLLSFKRNFNFKAGQVVALGLQKDDPPRFYSIASSENNPFIQILYDVKPDGKLTPQLVTKKAGDVIFSSDAFGSFVFKQSPACFIGVGTGIAPFASMVFSGFFKDCMVIQGSRYLNSFYFSNKFKDILKNNYIQCCSKETSDDVFSGRVTHYLESKNDLPKNYFYYLCGSAEMVVESRDILISKGIAFNQIIAETYF